LGNLSAIWARLRRAIRMANRRWATPRLAAKHRCPICKPSRPENLNAVLNLYFHVATAYAILRHNGVNFGKSGGLGDAPFKKQGARGLGTRCAGH